MNSALTLFSSTIQRNPRHHLLDTMDHLLSTVSLRFINAAMAEETGYGVGKEGLRVAAAATEGCHVKVIEALLEHVSFLEKRLTSEAESSREALEYYAEETERFRVRANDAERELAAQNEKVCQLMDANYALTTACAEKNAMLKAANSRLAELECALERSTERLEQAEAEAGRQMRLKETARADAEREQGRADDLQEAFDNQARAHAEDVETLRARNAEMFLELRQAKGYMVPPAGLEDIDSRDYDEWEGANQAFCDDSSPEARGEEV